MLLGALVPVAALLPLVAVEQAGQCPDAPALVTELNLQLDLAGRSGAVPGGVGQYRLRVLEDEPTRLRIEIVDMAGQSVLARDVTVAGSCGARARAVAVIVERWLAAIPAPVSEPGSSAPPRPVRRPPPTHPDRASVVQLLAGLVLAAGFDPASTSAGGSAGVAVRPLEWLRVTLDGALLLPHHPGVTGGTASVWIAGLGVRVGVPLFDRAVGLDLGPTLRLDVTSVSTSGLENDRMELRAQPALGLSLAARWRMAGTFWLSLAVNPWIALSGQSFYVDDGAARHDLYRTPGAGMRFDLGAAFDLSTGR